MQRYSRRLVLASALASAASVRWANAEEHGGTPEVPSSGGRRPGPIGPGASRSASRPRGVTPIEILIEKAGVDAPIEQRDIVDGVMQNPSGPWVVSWYDDLGALGERGNVVMSGHVDYWDVGPSVFWNLLDLERGDTIRILAEDEREFTYAVDWMKSYVVADMTEDDFDEMLGDAGVEALTLITCTIGTFDPVTQQYLERTALRAVETT